VDRGVLEKSGTWISFGSERMGQGRENARTFLKENKDVRDKLELALRKKLEIPIPSNPNGATAPGPNGHVAAPADGKPPVKASAAAAGADASRGRPAR
jgi:recombination protein RecA